MKTCEECGRAYPDNDWFAWKHDIVREDPREICYQCKYEELQRGDEPGEDREEERDGLVNGHYVFV